MRYVIFSDVHANLEALQAVLAKIDEIAEDRPIDACWFLGDLVGYGPDPNECMKIVRERADVIIAGNHDWAAVGKLDLEDFSDAARISAEWTAKQLSDEERTFLEELPERVELDGCTLVHGSPYGPLWEYITTEVFAERSFQYFDTLFCFVGHTHIPAIFQQPDEVANTPTHPLEESEINDVAGSEDEDNAVEIAETADIAATSSAASAAINTPVDQSMSEQEDATIDAAPHDELNDAEDEEENMANDLAMTGGQDKNDDYVSEDADDASVIREAQERLNSEIEELLELLGLSQSMIKVTNTMFSPSEGHWDAPKGNRFIINPGGVGQPRDGDPRAAFMVYDTEMGFEFYRVSYDFKKTQEKIIKAGLPQYLAIRLAFGR